MIDFTSGCCFFRGNLFVFCHHKPIILSLFFDLMLCIYFFSFYKIAAFVIEKPVTLVLQRNFIKNEMSGTSSSFLISQNLKIERTRNDKIYDTKRTFEIFRQNLLSIFFFFSYFSFLDICTYMDVQNGKESEMTGAHSMNIIIHV